MDFRGNFDLYAGRRKRLLEFVRENYSTHKEGCILLVGAFENDRYPFRQESSFYYLTGLDEPGLVLLMDFSGKTTLYIPQYTENRKKWCGDSLGISQKEADTIRVDEISYLGDPYKGYMPSPYFTKEQYKYLLGPLEEYSKSKQPICISSGLVEQKFVLDRITTTAFVDKEIYKDILPFVASMRRIKDKVEMELLYKAMMITGIGHEAALSLVKPGSTEKKIQSGVEFVFTESGATFAFPSIVASGKNTTILHYSPTFKELKKGELVVVDIGAEYEYYCADITRTYPVSGKFSKRQKELYKLVLSVQEYVAERAKPGLWINNKEKPTESLHHLAVEFLKKKGYEKYFTHGIGHFLGLDPHDAGDYTKPLQEGDFITIEPGLYIPEEDIGIRIEDNYWITNKGCVCISQDIPKGIKEIESTVGKDVIFVDDDDGVEF